jgi:hydroxymethylglutaryl-CoA reductase
MAYEFEGFYKKTVEERVRILSEWANLTEEEAKTFCSPGNMPIATADKMVENVVGIHSLPIGLAVNFLINGKERVVPMAIEEPSVVAASSNGAKLARSGGGFIAETDSPVMIGQIQLVNVADCKKAVEAIESAKLQLVKDANTPDAPMVKFGGGLRDIQCKILSTTRGEMLIVHILVDCRDSMGANSVNTYSEMLSPKLEALTGGTTRLKILSNLAVHRKARAKAVWTKQALEESFKGEYSGELAIEAILDAYAFAEADPYRATTHNKGVMNGVSAVVVATGNDWRAVEAGAHSFAAVSGKYKPLTRYWKNESGELVGEIELPIAIGTVGGTTAIHPTAKIAQKIIGAATAQELAGIMACVGLAQNFAALRALSTEGIQKGHLKLHGRHVASIAGVPEDMIDKVAAKMAERKVTGKQDAIDILKELEKTPA